MTFKDIQVHVRPSVGWYIQWEASGMESGWQFQLQRAPGPEGPWTDVVQLDRKTLSFIDSEKPYRNFYDLFFYRLKAIDESGNVKQVSKPVSEQEEPSDYTLEVIRQHSLVLEGANTHDGFMVRSFACFKRAIDGTRCTDCVDDLTGERFRDRCTTCNGTGYIEGWSNPIVFKGRFRQGIQKQTEHQDTPVNESNDERRQIFMANHPVLEPNDILIEKESGKHWEVVRIDASEPNGVLVSQRPLVKRVNRDYIESELKYPGEQV